MRRQMLYGVFAFLRSQFQTHRATICAQAPMGVGDLFLFLVICINRSGVFRLLVLWAGVCLGGGDICEMISSPAEVTSVSEMGDGSRWVGSPQKRGASM